MSADPSARYAVTGGCGFIGSHLVEALLASGASRVLVIDSMEYGQAGNLPSHDARLEIRSHRLGGLSGEFLAEALRGIDYIFHLAAEKHNQSIDEPLKVIEANVAGTHELLAASRKCGVRKVVFTSSLYAYGRMGGGPFVETEVPGPETVYGMSKLAGEYLCRHFQAKFGLPWVGLRYLFIYGPRQFARTGYKSVIVKNFERLLAGQPPVVNGDGRQALDYVYVDDAVELTLRAMHAPLSGRVVNVCSGRAVSVLELTEAMQRVAGTRHPAAFAPPDATHGSSRAGDPALMRELLGEPRVALAEGLSRTFAWMKARAGAS